MYRKNLTSDSLSEAWLLLSKHFASPPLAQVPGGEPRARAGATFGASQVPAEG